MRSEWRCVPLSCGERIRWTVPPQSEAVTLGVTGRANRRRVGLGDSVADDVVRFAVGIKGKVGLSSFSFLTYHPQQWPSPAQTSARCVSHFRIARSHTTRSSPTHADLVRPVSSQVVIVPGLISFPVSFAVVLPPLGVFLERGCGADLCINILLVSRLSHSSLSNSANVASQTILGYMYVCALTPSSSPAHQSLPGQPRNYSRFVVHANPTDCFRS